MQTRSMTLIKVIYSIFFFKSVKYTITGISPKTVQFQSKTSMHLQNKTLKNLVCTSQKLSRIVLQHHIFL